MENVIWEWNEEHFEKSAEEYGKTMEALFLFMNGHDTPDTVNPNVGNRILVRESVGSWKAAYSGIMMNPNFESAINDGGLDFLVEKIWEVDGTLHMSGLTDEDDFVKVEIKQLTNKGETLIDEVERTYRRFPCTAKNEGIAAMGKTYVGEPVGEFIEDLWNDPELCTAPNYLERIARQS